jgi:hypothetical protein
LQNTLFFLFFLEGQLWDSEKKRVKFRSIESKDWDRTEEKQSTNYASLRLIVLGLR